MTNRRYFDMDSFQKFRLSSFLRGPGSFHSKFLNAIILPNNETVVSF